MSINAGIWCGYGGQLAVGLPCDTAGAYALIYQNTFGNGGLVPNNNVWTTVETSSAAVTGNAGITCSGNATCLSANNCAGIVSKNVACSTGQYVTIHEEFSIVCVASVQFNPATYGG